MNNLLTAHFWLDQFPEPLIPSMANTLIAVILVFIILTIIGIVISRRRGFYAPLFKKITAFGITNSIFGALLFLFCQQMIPFLSARAWFALWAIGIIAWTYFIVRYANKLPAKKKQIEEELKFKKYLP